MLACGLSVTVPWPVGDTARLNWLAGDWINKAEMEGFGATTAKGSGLVLPEADSPNEGALAI